MSGSPYSTLVLDYNSLLNAGTELTAVSDAFKTASTDAKKLASDIGGVQTKLASTVEDFATKWDNRRTDLRNALDGLSQEVTQIGKAFHDSDNQLSQSLIQ